MMTQRSIPHPHNEAAAWYTVYCKPNKEALAARALQTTLGLCVYLPELCLMQQGKLSPVLCFPRYLFVQVNLQATAIHHIYAIPGIVRLVGFDAGPQAVPAAAIEAIQQQVEQFNRRTHHPEQPFQPGDIVRLREGPLRGLEGLLVEADSSRKRVKVLIHMLGQLSRAEVNSDMLEHAEAPPTDHLPRRTRGRGRRIRTRHDIRVK